MAPKIQHKRQSQTGAAAVGKVPSASSVDFGELVVNTVDGKVFLKRQPVSGPAEVVEVGKNPLPDQSGQVGKYLSTNGTALFWDSPEANASMTREFYQPAHGFAVGTVLQHNGSTFVRAQATSAANASVVGVVVGVPTSNEIVLAMGGVIELPTDSYVVGRTYFLSAVSAGGVTDTEPTTVGQVSKPVFIVAEVIPSAQPGGPLTRAFLVNWRGVVNAAAININTILPAQSPSTANKQLTSNGSTAYWGTGVPPSQAQLTITQTAHAFTVGTLIRYDGTTSKYVKSRANTAANSEITGMVSSVTNANTFVMITHGVVTGLTGLTAGATYYLSDSTAGTFSSTAPTLSSSLSKPVMIATGTTTALFCNWRGISNLVLSYSPEVASQTGHSGKFLTTNGASTAWSLPVTSFNSRTGSVTLTSSDVTAALGFTPYNATNPSGYVTPSTPSFTSNVSTTGTFLASNGTATAPSFTFSSDTNTGMYRYASDTLGFTTGGTLGMTIENDGDVGITKRVMLASDGNATTPAFTWSSDPDTGMYRTGTNGLTLAAGGQAKISITTTEVVTWSQNRAANGTVANPHYSFWSDNASGMHLPAVNVLGFVTGGAQRVYINTSQFVVTAGVETQLLGAAYCNSPSTSANDTRIANTAWVRTTVKNTSSWESSRGSVTSYGTPPNIAVSPTAMSVLSSWSLPAGRGSYTGWYMFLLRSFNGGSSREQWIPVFYDHGTKTISSNFTRLYSAGSDHYGFLSSYPGTASPPTQIQWVNTYANLATYLVAIDWVTN